MPKHTRAIQAGRPTSDSNPQLCRTSVPVYIIYAYIFSLEPTPRMGKSTQGFTSRERAAWNKPPPSRPKACKGQQPKQAEEGSSIQWHSQSCTRLCENFCPQDCKASPGPKGKTKKNVTPSPCTPSPLRVSRGPNGTNPGT